MPIHRLVLQSLHIMWQLRSPLRSCPCHTVFFLPARQVRLQRAAQRTVLQAIEPDEYIPGLDLEVPPEREELPGFTRRFSAGTGPYTVSHGVPTDETERDPPFLTDQDWHISSTYDVSKLKEVGAREQADSDAVVELTDEERRVITGDPFAVKEYMQLELGEDTSDGPPVHELQPTSQVGMPSSWQEFQFLQNSVAKYEHGSEQLPVPAADIKDAKRFGVALDEIYPVFKTVLQEGWDFVFDPEIEEAGLFVQRMRKWEETLGGERKAVIEWDLNAEQQPFVGENKHD